MNSTLTFISVVIIVLTTLMLWLKLKDLNILKQQVYDLVSFGRNGNLSKDELSNILKKSSCTPPFTDLTLEFVLRQLQHEHKIVTSTLRVMCGTDVTHITTYVLCPSLARVATRKNLHLS